MRTTLDLDDALLTQAKALAAQRHTSLTRLIEDALAARLRGGAVSSPATSPVDIPVYPGRGGLSPAIADTASQRALLDALDAAEPPRC